MPIKLLVLTLLSLGMAVAVATVQAQRAGKKPPTTPAPTSPRSPTVATPPTDSTPAIHLALIARSYGDSIVLRWAPETHLSWDFINSAGYQLERVALNSVDNEPLAESFRPVPGAPFKPWTLDEWRARGVARDSQAVIAAWALTHRDKPRSGKDLIGELAEISQVRANRFAYGMLAADRSRLAATGLALRYVDRDVQPGRKYIYKLSVPLGIPSMPIDTTYFVIAADDVWEDTPPSAPRVDVGDRVLSLSWRAAREFAAYDVERSEDSLRWRRINRNPYIMLTPTNRESSLEFSFVDTTVVNDRRYYYRLRGYDSFGYLSEPSAARGGTPVDQTPGAVPYFTSAENTSGLTVEMNWAVDDMTGIKGFIVSRAPDFNGPFVPLHPQPLGASVRSFADKAADEFGTSFYKVTSFDARGNLAHGTPYFVKIKNQAPPAVPTGLSATVHTNGILRVHWHANLDPDIKGYYVAFANQSYHPFTNLTQETLLDTVLVDTLELQTLSEVIYLKIKAIDLDFAASEFSEILEVRKPDLVPPVAPIFREYEVRDTGIYLSWVRSSSLDVASQVLIRTPVSASAAPSSDKKGSTKPVALPPREFALGLNDSLFVDTVSAPLQRFEYRLYAVDDAGLRSPSSAPVELKPLRVSSRGTGVRLSAKPAPDSTLTQLSWTAVAGAGERYMLYSGTDANTLTMYRAVIPPITSMLVPARSEGAKLLYAIRVERNDGWMGGLAVAE